MLPILEAQESLRRINEVMYATGNMRNPDTFIRPINTLAQSLQEKPSTDLSKLTPKQRRAYIERLGWKVV